MNNAYDHTKEMFNLNTYKEILDYACSRIAEMSQEDFTEKIQPFAQATCFLKISSGTFSSENAADFLAALVKTEIIADEDVDMVSPRMLETISRHIANRMDQTP